MSAFLDHAHAVLVFADKLGWQRALDFASAAAGLGIQVEFHILGSDVDDLFSYEALRETVAVWTLEVAQDKNLIYFLQEKTMGTRLFVCASEKKVRRLQGIFELVGFAREEVNFETVSVTSQTVICIGCYGMNESEEKDIIQCRHCNRHLAVSKHYSSKLRAVIGYLILPEQYSLPLR